MRHLVGVGLALVVLAGVLVSGCAGSVSDRPTAAARAVCSPAARAAPVLGRVRIANAPVPGRPYSVVATRSGRWSFVSLPRAVAVMSNRGFVPRLVRVIRLPAGVASGRHDPALTADGLYLLVSSASGAVVIDAARAERGDAGAVLGRLVSPVRAGAEAQASAGAVVGSHGGRYVFVAREGAGGVAVFDLYAALASGLRSSGFIGTIPVDIGPVALAISPSGNRLYVASVATPLTPGATAGGGTLSVIDATRAELRPSRSVLQKLPAGCEPVSVVTSSSGRLVWVASLADHAVVGFAASRLVRDPAHARLAVVRVPGTPVGLLSFAGGRRLLVAESSRSSGAQRLSVIDTAQALAHRPALVGSMRAGLYPRQLALLPRRATALLANYGSGQVEAIDLAAIP